MDYDSLDDLLTDPSPKPGARAGGKFQPKAKAKAKPPPRKEPPPSAKTLLPVPVSDISSNQLNGSTARDKDDPFRSNVPHSSLPTSAGEQGHSSFEKPAEGPENGDLYIGLEFLDDDYHPQTTTTISVITETPTIHTSDDQNAEGEPVSPALRNPADACTRSECPAQISALMGGEGSIFNNDGDLHIESRAEYTDDFPCLEALDVISESTSRSGRRSGKFQPIPKLQPCKTKQDTVVPNPDELESVLLAKNTPSIPLQTEYMVEGSSPSFQGDDVIDLSCIGFSDSIATDPASDFQVNEDSANFIGTSPTEHLEAGPEMPVKKTKRGRRKVPAAPGPAVEHQNASTSSPEVQAGKYTGRLRKRTSTHELLDESEDEDRNDDFALDNEDGTDNDAEYVVENEALNERPLSRSKKPAAEKEKPVRKRKKPNSESAEATKAPKKKFSHTTRRNKRSVDPDLLKIPEDEIDFQNLPLKTRIRLAEHKERMGKNGATRSDTSLMNESVAGFSGYHGEDAASHGRNTSDEYEDSAVPETSNSFNYRTHMKITPRARWSKQDTELFYEVLQQFGTDLTMIAECFPGRTRQQIKLKYKNEERRNPSRLHDALATRAKGSSHFELVIERLKQIAAQDQDDNSDDPINLTGQDPEEVVVDTNEAAKSELPGEEEAQDMEPEVLAAESSLKSDDSEDDMYTWSQYRSEI